MRVSVYIWSSRWLCKIDKVDLCKDWSCSSAWVKHPSYSCCECILIQPSSTSLPLLHFLPSLHLSSLSCPSFQLLILCWAWSGMELRLPLRNEGLILPAAGILPLAVSPWDCLAWRQPPCRRSHLLSEGSPYPVTDSGEMQQSGPACPPSEGPSCSELPGQLGFHPLLFTGVNLPALFHVSCLPGKPSWNICHVLGHPADNAICNERHLYYSCQCDSSHSHSYMCTHTY